MGKWVDISYRNLLWVVVVVFVANEKSSMEHHDSDASSCLCSFTCYYDMLLTHIACKYFSVFEATSVYQLYSTSLICVCHSLTCEH